MIPQHRAYVVEVQPHGRERNIYCERPEHPIILIVCAVSLQRRPLHQYTAADYAALKRLLAWRERTAHTCFLGTTWSPPTTTASSNALYSTTTTPVATALSITLLSTTTTQTAVIPFNTLHLTTSGYPLGTTACVFERRIYMRKLCYPGLYDRESTFLTTHHQAIGRLSRGFTNGKHNGGVSISYRSL